jgi:hypothetical protein
MTSRDIKEHMDSKEERPHQRSKETHSGTPNAVDPAKARDTEHQSGYGGEGGDPKTSSDERQSHKR